MGVAARSPKGVIHQRYPAVTAFDDVGARLPRGVRILIATGHRVEQARQVALTLRVVGVEVEGGSITVLGAELLLDAICLGELTRAALADQVVTREEQAELLDLATDLTEDAVSVLQTLA